MGLAMCLDQHAIVRSLACMACVTVCMRLLREGTGLKGRVMLQKVNMIVGYHLYCPHYADVSLVVLVEALFPSAWVGVWC